MKPKLHVEVLEALCLQVAVETTILANRLNPEAETVYAVHTKAANKLQLEGSEKPYFTITADSIVKQEGKQPVWKKLYHRDYQVTNKSLTEVMLQAYQEFLTVAVATFFLSAQNTAPEVLEQVSQPSHA